MLELPLHGPDPLLHSQPRWTLPVYEMRRGADYSVGWLMNAGRPIPEQIETWNRFTSYHVPIGLIDDRIVSIYGAMLWAKLQAIRGNPKDKKGRPRKRFVAPSYKFLAQFFDVSQDTIGRWVAELVKARLIYLHRRGPGQSPEFIFLDHPALHVCEPDNGNPEEQKSVEADSPKQTSQEVEESAYLPTQETTESAYLPTQAESRVGIFAAESRHICGQESAKMPSALKDELGSSNLVLLNTHPSSSSSSSKVGVESPNDDEEDCPSSLPQHQPPKPSAEERRGIAMFLQQSLATNMNSGLGGDPKPPTEHLIDEVFKAAPGWTGPEIAEALRINGDESPGRPRGYRWFAVTTEDVYRKRSGKPPALPEKRRPNILDNSPQGANISQATGRDERKQVIIGAPTEETILRWVKVRSAQSETIRAALDKTPREVFQDDYEFRRLIELIELGQHPAQLEAAANETAERKAAARQHSATEVRRESQRARWTAIYKAQPKPIQQQLDRMPFASVDDLEQREWVLGELEAGRHSALRK
jgi:hypothetical protein